MPAEATTMATKMCCVVDGSSWSLLVASFGCGKDTDTVPNPQLRKKSKRKKSKTTNSLLEGEENNQTKAKETFNINEIVQQPQQQQQQPQKVKASQTVGSLDDRRSKNNRVALHITRGWQFGKSRENVKKCDLYAC